MTSRTAATFSGLCASIACAAALMLCSLRADASERCTPEKKTQRNADGSSVGIVVRCAAEDLRMYVLSALSPKGRERNRILVEQPVEETPFGSANFVDIDHDGFHEIEIRGMCGAGPNCEGDLYRVDRKTGKLYHFFSGGYADLSLLDGHLVEAGRASCCAWEFHAYRLSGPARLHDYDTMAMMITVGADLSAPDGTDAIVCKFMRRVEGEWQVVDPPNAKWLSLCEHYGEPYHLVTPAEAAAERSGGTQTEHKQE